MSDEYEHGQSEDHGYVPGAPPGPVLQKPTVGFKGDLTKEMEASQKIVGALAGEVSDLRARAREGDSLAIDQIAKQVIGGHKSPGQFEANVLEAAGIYIKEAAAILMAANQRRGMERWGTLHERIQRIADWAERLVVWGEVSTPPREDLFYAEAIFRGEGPGRHPKESWEDPKIPRALKGQKNVVRWLTWLGFDVEPARVAHESVVATELVIQVRPGRLIDEADRLQLAVAARGAEVPHIVAIYEPHLGTKGALSVIRMMLADEAMP